MQACLLVGAGGFIGAVFRYLLGQIPLQGDYPVITMLINLVGSFAIGVVAEFSAEEGRLSPQTALFLKTGLCGGFTTFSTFSLETITLLQNKKLLIGAAYAILSVILCLAGTFLGMLFAKAVKAKLSA